MPQDKAQIRLKVYDRARHRVSKCEDVLLRVHNGQTTQSFTKTLNTKSLNEGNQDYESWWMIMALADIQSFCYVAFTSAKPLLTARHFVNLLGAPNDT